MEEKKRNRKSIPLLIIIIGIILLVIGIVVLNFTDMSKYNKTEDISFSQNGDDVSKLDISSGIACFELKKSTDSKINVTCENVPEGYYSIDIENGTLFVRCDEYFEHFDFSHIGNWFNWGSFGNYVSPRITIELPEKTYDDVKIQLGVGDNTISSLNCITADIDFGVGTADVSNLTCTVAEISMGTGDVSLTDCTLTKADIHCGVGEFNYSGKILGKSEISCGVGDSTFDIDGNRGDYSVDTDSGVGKVKVTGSGAGNAGISLEVSCGVGDVELNFD